MQRMAIALPIRPGRTEALRRYVAELTGPRAEADAAFQRKYGVHRQTVWLQHGVDGELLVLYQEVEDLDRAREGREEINHSDDPHLAWKRAAYEEIYGFGPDAGPPPTPELLADRTF